VGHRRVSAVPAPGPPALAVSEIAKTYAATRALQGVSLEVAPGSVHAILGSNGSGKSTLIKILAGIVRADPGGVIRVAGTEIQADAMTPELARRAGLRFVHQHTVAFPGMTVAENLALGHGFEHSRSGRIRWRAQHRRANAVCERFYIDARPDTPVQKLAPATLAMLAIARALQDVEEDEDSVLVLDEPTAALPAPEVSTLLTMLRRYASMGQTIVFITHRLQEVVDLADAATVLRDGQVADRIPSDEITEDRLVEAIVGGKLERMFPAASTPAASGPLLELDAVSVGPLHDVSLSLRAGEVVGLAGLEGSGRSLLLEALFGVRHARGRVLLDGQPYRPANPSEAIATGVALVPGDRAARGVFAGMSVVENVSMASVSNYWHGLRLRHKRERGDAAELSRRFQIRTDSVLSPVSTLSGGNQQKVLLSRWLRRSPRLLLLDEPTQGIDIGARADIYRFMRDAVDAGAAALVVSSDFEELAGMCDRVLVLVRGGGVAAELSGAELDSDRINDVTLRTSMVAS
jgi:ribose transport system ATP-binding protein